MPSCRQGYFNGCGNHYTQAITQYDERDTQSVEGTEEKPVVRLVSGQSTREPDIVSVEAALSMAVSFPGIDEQSLGLTMRTPGQDELLIVGYLHSEGIIDSIDHVMEVNATEDTVTAHLTKDANFEPNDHVRRSTITSSCGICGKDSISNLLHVHGPPLSDSFKVNQQDVSNAVTNLAAHQNAFKLTGGTHACARVLRGGVVIDAQEDIGRHNACLLYTSPSPRDKRQSRMPSSA